MSYIVDFYPSHLTAGFFRAVARTRSLKEAFDLCRSSIQPGLQHLHGLQVIGEILDPKYAQFIRKTAIGPGPVHVMANDGLSAVLTDAISYEFHVPHLTYGFHESARHLTFQSSQDTPPVLDLIVWRDDSEEVLPGATVRHTHAAHKGVEYSFTPKQLQIKHPLAPAA